MTHRNTSLLALFSSVGALAFGLQVGVCADDPADLKQQVDALQKQNAAMQEQLQKQQQMIDLLSRKVEGLQAVESAAATNRTAAIPEASEETRTAEKSPSGFSLNNVHISGEGGLTFFESGSEGMYPHSEFRVDEARLFVESPVWNDVYFFSEVDLATPEEDGIGLQLGELYLDFEDVSKLWGQDRLLNVRAGRFNIPFGEEYLARYAIDNPLISRSLSDLWGLDEGIEVYGAAGKMSYVLAVQNGGYATGHDYNADKSVTGRVSYDPNRWLHLSLSAMRTGNIDPMNDYWSALWFANAWITSIGSTNTTEFHANLVEGDVAVRLPRGQIKAFGGTVRYGDNDPSANNARDLYYYSIEGVNGITGKLYGAARFSQIIADKGYPIVGNGNFGEYFFGSSTTRLWRLSLGLGYRFSDHLVLKTEYTFERGRELGGDPRDHEDLFAAEAAFKF